MATRGRIYHNFYTEELWEQVNKENKRIMDDFLQEYKQRKKSKGTISGYRNDLRIILIYVLRELDNRCILDLKKKDFRNLSLYFTEECEMSAARTNRLKSAINSLLTFCEDDDDYEYEINYAKKVKGIPKSRVKDDEDDFFFTYDEFVKVRDILVAEEKWQLAVLWSIGFDSAGRKNELFQIQKHGLLDGNKTNIVIGKRGKKFPLVYLDDTRELIKKYLEWRGDDDIDSLWIKGSGDHKEPISNSNVLYDRIVSISKILSEVRGEPCNIFTHTMRHSRLECLSQGTDLRLLDENGNPKKYPLEQIQIFAHHSDPSTTQGYLKDHSEDTINSMFGI
jgi:integrase|uniref:Integrase n=1 Tax=virus sp. ctmTa7 TaxID=2828255 RepID=A0A8S5RC67_9VIRU|nr:MAG TPA: Integrase [virus sp. ctmTa7]DAU18268.1 MAG TPA: Integrase [Bacteriophage sp.]